MLQTRTADGIIKDVLHHVVPLAAEPYNSPLRWIPLQYLFVVSLTFAVLSTAIFGLYQTTRNRGLAKRYLTLVQECHATKEDQPVSLITVKDETLSARLFHLLIELSIAAAAATGWGVTIFVGLVFAGLPL